MTPVIGAGFLGIEHFTPPWDVFFLPLFNLLIASYRIIFSDFALAIIVFTVVIRTLLAPLFVRQINSQKEMQRMAPLIREVSRKHKGNLRFDALTQTNRPNHMTVVEMWAADKDQEAHQVTADVKNFRDALSGLVPGSGVAGDPLFLLNPLTGSLYDERLYKLID